jgi:quinol monooxygenase YgiN
MIMMKIKGEVTSSKQKEFLQAISSLKCSKEKQKGLRKLSFYQEIDNADNFALIYEWDTRKEMDEYLGEDRFRVPLGAIKVLGKNSEISFMRPFNESGGPISRENNNKKIWNA